LSQALTNLLIPGSHAGQTAATLGESHLAFTQIDSRGQRYRAPSFTNQTDCTTDIS